MAISPDGAWIAYGLRPDPIAAQHDVYFLASDGSRQARIIEHPADDTPVAWTPDGSHLLFRSRRSGNEALWAVSLDDGHNAGAPRLVNSDTSILSSIGVTPEGDLYYLKSTGSRDIYEAEVSVSTGALIKPPEPISTGIVGGNTVPVFSPDGRSLAYFSNRSLRRYADRVIVVRNIQTGEELDFAPSVRAVRNLTWSPDSKSLLFRARDGKGRSGAYRMTADGGDAEFVFQLPGSATNLGWMPDGSSIHYREKGGPGGAHWLYDVSAGERRQIVPPVGDSWLQVSPDGTQFSRVDRRREKDTTLLLTLDIETGRERELLRLSRPDGCELPTQWTPDGKTILFWRFSQSKDDKSRRELWSIPAGGGEARKTSLAFSRITGRGYLSLHPDGSRIAFSAGDPKHEIWKLSNFLSRLGMSD